MRTATKDILGLAESLDLTPGTKWVVTYPDGSKEHAVLQKPFTYGGKTSYDLELKNGTMEFFLTKDGKRLSTRLGYRGKEGTAYATPA